MRTAGLILAAGQGARFGDAPKQLADLGGRPLLQWAIDAQCDVDPRLLDPIVLVLGARSDEVRAGIDPRRARIAVCADWRQGQSASLRHGLAELGGDPRRVLVTLGDVPLLSCATIARFAAQPAPARATCGGRPGHPVLLGATELKALDAVRGDRGARDLLARAPTIELPDPACGIDVDTPDQLDALRRHLRHTVSGQPGGGEKELIDEERAG